MLGDFLFIYFFLSAYWPRAENWLSSSVQKQPLEGWSPKVSQCLAFIQSPLKKHKEKLDKKNLKLAK